MFKRIGLFLITNILVIATISIIMNVLGIRPYLEESGINYTSLLIFASIWGMGGAFISLALSKTMVKWSMGVKIIDPRSASGGARQLIQVVHSLSQKARLPKMPEVGIYESGEVNAFATGPGKSNSLVAVSTGLLESMSWDEIEGVLGHEVSHISNGDMVTMTLIQGVVNAFSIFLSRIVAFFVANFISGDDEDGPSFFLQYALIIVFDIFFTILGSIATAAFSRHREFRADAGSAKIAGKTKMISALERLRAAHSIQDKRSAGVASLKISSRPGWMALFSTHPPLEDRIKRLQNG